MCIIYLSFQINLYGITMISRPGCPSAALLLLSLLGSDSDSLPSPAYVPISKFVSNPQFTSYRTCSLARRDWGYCYGGKLSGVCV